MTRAFRTIEHPTSGPKRSIRLYQFHCWRVRHRRVDNYDRAYSRP